MTGIIRPQHETIELRETVVLRDLEARVFAAGQTFDRRPRFVWRGPPAVPVFALQNSRESVWEHIDVVCETPCEAVFLIERTRSGAGVIPSTMHQWRDVRVFGNGLGVPAFVHRATIDENNEHGRWDSCSVYGCIVGWTFQGQQSKEHLMTHCRFESGVTAVSSDSSFQWVGGTAAVCDTGIFLTRIGDPVAVRGVGFEACKRLLVTVNASTASQPVTLDGVRYEADQLHADGDAIVLRHAGPLNVVGSTLGDGRQRIPRIALLGIGAQAATIAGNKFGAFGAHRVCPIRAQNRAEAKVDWGRNTYQRDGNDPRNTETRIAWATRYYE
jgi:hypothetical protein